MFEKLLSFERGKDSRDQTRARNDEATLILLMQQLCMVQYLEQEDSISKLGTICG
jgi:hypothetical protein